MKVIIIEDEIKTARALAKLIKEVEESAEIITTLQSIKETINYFDQTAMPDLIFMDVQLSDGICFDIFEEIEITCPVIFCTAFDEYALEGFQANGIDYILKPFTKDTLKKSFEKIKKLKIAFQQEDDTNTIPNALSLNGKQSFLVFTRNRYITIPTTQIAYFFIKNDLPALFTFKEETYFINESLKVIASQLSPKQFYRVTRQYLINFEAIKEVEQHYDRKLWIHLNVPNSEKLIINKNNTVSFMRWMATR